MRKLIIILIVFFFNSTITFAEENKCNEFKKFSKEYIVCNAKKLKEVSSKKAKELKDGTSKKTKELKEGTSKKTKKLKENLVEIGDKFKDTKTFQGYEKWLKQQENELLEKTLFR